MRGAPLPEAIRRASRARGEAGTTRRVETALFGSIAARPANTEIELVSVAGVRVDLHVA